MRPHTSQHLQPLDASCFSPLKRAYSHEIQELARQGIYYVDKVDFLTTYTRIQPTVCTQQNIRAGFQATGPIPYYPDRVLSSFTVVRTPSPPATTQAIRQLVKGCQLAMNSATILTEENRKLRTAS
jgi:hypothetical protein